MDAAGHLETLASRVVISGHSDDADVTFGCGVNEHAFDPDRHVLVSNASFTTNCLATVAKVLSDSFEVEHLMMSTIHA